MESVANAVSLAASAASLALDASTDAVAPLWSQLQLILSAALQVTSAFWLLLGEALGQLGRAVLTHPKLAVAVVGVPAASVALNVRKNWRLAIELFHELAKSLLQANDFSYGATISACEKAVQWRQAVWLLDQRKPDLPSFNSACSACRGLAWREALQLMRTDLRLRLNVISFNSASSACEKASEWWQALMLLEDLQQHWLSPDVITCNTCISACQAQPWWLAIQLGLSPSPICVTPSLVTYNATISSCRDTWVEALALFASLLRSRTSPDVVTSNAAISACCTYWQRAFLLFHELRIAEQMQRDIMTDIITYGAVIKASENAALWQSAVSSLGELNIQSLQIDVIACNSSISACEKAAQWQQSICLLTEQYLRGLRSDACSHDAVVRGFYESLVAHAAAGSTAGKSLSWRTSAMLLSRASKTWLQPDHAWWNSSLSACEKAFQWRESLNFYGTARFHGYGEAAAGPVAVACAHLGFWKRVLQMLDLGDEEMVLGSAITACEKWTKGVVPAARIGKRQFINLSWERGLRDSRSGRLQSAGRRGALAEVSMGGHSSGESDMDEARWEEVEREEKSPIARAESKPLADASPSMLSVLQEERTKGCRFFMGGLGGGSFAKSDECLEFLEKRIEDVQYKADELVFQQGNARSAFLVVKQGEVVVEHGCRSADVYSLGPGNAIVGLLFMLASIPASTSAANSAWSVHSSSARAGAHGALVSAVPLEAFQEAFDRFPKAMQRLVQRLSLRFSTVVFETLSTYFGLRLDSLPSCPCRELFFFDFALMGCSMSGGALSAVPENEAHVSTQAEAVNSGTVVGEFPEAEAMVAMTDMADPTPRKGMSMISEAPTVDTFVAEFDLWPESITSPECRERFRRVLEAAPEMLERKVASKRCRDFGLQNLIQL
eukprot:symbB.v1.2.036496.t2/scaffold5169.1/size30165/2